MKSFVNMIDKKAVFEEDLEEPENTNSQFTFPISLKVSAKKNKV